ncbi:hypothetical protein EST92_16275 [Streptomyces sp. TM32]|nr:hypothetical protein EST92_16275 [Streptomyces sp. TM32]
MDQLAHNRFLHEQYKAILRSEMSKPLVSDPDLARQVDKMFRPNAVVGNGSTAAAARWEILTNGKVGGRGHLQKAQDNINFLRKWMRANPDEKLPDYKVATDLLRDLENALEGKPRL